MEPKDSDGPAAGFDPDDLLEAAERAAPEAVSALRQLAELPERLGLQALLPERWRSPARLSRPPLPSPTDQKLGSRKREGTLADLVLAHRRDNALTQSEFAAKAHIDERTIRRIEHGAKPSPQTLAELAGAMDMKPSDLPKN
jgi:DNA-binding XRE family transcriptional regulator